MLWTSVPSSAAGGVVVVAADSGTSYAVLALTPGEAATLADQLRAVAQEAAAS